MAQCTVLLFSYAGVVQASIAGQQNPADAFLMDKQPYLARQNLTPTDAQTADSTSALTPAGTDYVLIQVQPGFRVYYEVNPPGRTVVEADTSSPYISGDVRVKCTPGTTFSFRDYIVT